MLDSRDSSLTAFLKLKTKVVHGDKYTTRGSLEAEVHDIANLGSRGGAAPRREATHE
jgi:hypothetical protein